VCGGKRMCEVRSAVCVKALLFVEDREGIDVRRWRRE
jgi:hypothetical protein